MTRTMGDAIHANVGTLVMANPEMVAGYVTGTPDIKWTVADWARFIAIPRVTIDQGFQPPATTTATVRDVETGAWDPASAVHNKAWTAARPTIYCNRSNLPAILANGWQGDLWLAYPGWQPGQPLPAAPGCNYVAVQNQLDVNNAYDLSVVLDDTWPEATMPIPQLQQDVTFCSLCGVFYYAPSAKQACAGNNGGAHVSAGTGPFAVLYAQ